MGFIVIAKGARNLLFWSEMGWTVVYIALSWVCVTVFALNGTGIAFFGSYIFHVLMVYTIVHRLTGFQYSVANIQISVLFVLTISLVFCGFYMFSYRVAMAVGIVVLTATSIYSMRKILNLVEPALLPRPIVRLLGWIRLIGVPVR
jgi:PST family polysaccharide transporter